MAHLIRTLLAALAVLAVAVPAAKAQSRTPVHLKVMTRNIYLGGNIFHPIGEQDPVAFRRKTGELWAQIQQTDFVGTRARLLAREVKRTSPDVIGLQEVALWRRGPDGVTDGATTPATTVVYNFLRTYERALRRLGLRYTTAVVQREADIEAPIDQGYDVRLTMHDVILVRKRGDLRIIKRSKDNFEADIGVPTPAGTLASRRGWTAVDARLRGRRFRFVNTHLESAAPGPRNAQAAELVARGGPLRVKGKPVILVGDMNSDPNGRESDPDAVNIFKSFGLRDLWPRVVKGSPGFSCCLDDPLLSDTTSAAFDHRIDLLLSKPALRGRGGAVVGNRPRDRAANGLWPSDHAGVVLDLRLP